MPNSSGLLAVRTFVIPKRILAETATYLQEAGVRGVEAFVIWGGMLEAETAFRFSSAIRPEQQALRTAAGLLVVVDGDALFEVNKALHLRGEILGGQVHSHPGAAYHSSTDDHFPLATLVGALSAVVPDFGRNAPSDIRNWAWYRLREYGDWAPIADTRLVIE